MKEATQPSVEERLLKEKKPQSVEALTEKYGVTARQLRLIIKELQAEGLGVGTEGDTVYRTKAPLEAETHDLSRQFRGRTLRFGLISDTHLSSKKQRLDALQDMYDLFVKEGITHVFHCGDLSEGQNIFRGQELEVLHFGQEEQIEYAIKAYPKRKGIKTHWIGGNHDLKMYERGGVDPGPQIERARPDMPYLGQYSTRIRFSDGVEMELIHPAGSSAYALTYKMQRWINSLGTHPGDRPSILAMGHWHYSAYANYQDIHGLMVPSFKSQGSFEKRLGLGSKVGGWIIEARLSQDRSEIERFQPELVEFRRGK